MDEKDLSSGGSWARMHPGPNARTRPVKEILNLRNAPEKQIAVQSASRAAEDFWGDLTCDEFAVARGTEKLLSLYDDLSP